MSLIDSDKENGDRANPKLNVDDNVANRMSHETLGTTYRRTGSNVTQGIVFQQGKFQSYDSAGRINMGFGYYPSINTKRPILRIAKDGFDATTATSDNLIFNSEQNVFKIVKTDTITMPAVSATAGPFWTQTSSFSVAHGLGYVPIVLAYYVVSANNLAPFVTGMDFAVYDPTTGIPSSFRSRSIVTTDTNLNISLTYYDRAGNSYNAFQLKYYLLQEAAI